MEQTILKLNLIKVFLLKEKKFWQRTWEMKNKINLFWFIIAIILISIGHYAFAFMHFLFECFLWLVARKQYRLNLYKLYKQVKN